MPFAYDYQCKKNGRTYTYNTELTFDKPQDAYAWWRGVREYADNYHASVGHPDSTAKNAFNGTVDEFMAEIDKLSNEALERFNAGDVPGQRGVTDPDVIEARKLTAELVKLGIKKMTPEIMAALVKSAEKAQSKAA